MLLKFLFVGPIPSRTVHVDAASTISNMNITDLAVFIHTLQLLNERKVSPAPIPTSIQSECTVVTESLHQFLMAASCHPRPFELSGKGKTWTTILKSLMGHYHQLIHRQAPSCSYFKKEDKNSEKVSFDRSTQNFIEMNS